MTSDDRTCRINVRIGAACVELLDHRLSIPQSERAERMRLLATIGLNELRRPAAGAAPGASLREGDWVLVDRRAAGMPIKDGLYIVRMAGVPFLRHFSVRPDGKILALMGSAALPPIEMPEDMLTPENIVGKVVVTLARV